MAIKGPYPRLDGTTPHHERDETPDARQRPDQRVSQQYQQQFQGPTTRTSHFTGRGVACRVDVADGPGSRPEQCRHRRGSSYQSGPLRLSDNDPQMDRHRQPIHLRLFEHHVPSSDRNDRIGRDHECQSNRVDGE